MSQRGEVALLVVLLLAAAWIIVRVLLIAASAGAHGHVACADACAPRQGLMLTRGRCHCIDRE